jgi:DNA-directed RNA polymerase subunit RPC12/RpoP
MNAPSPPIARETRPAPAPARPRAAPDPSLAVGATCPECGGAIRIMDGDRSVRCGYCRSALLIVEPRGVQSYLLPPTVTPAKARLAAIHCIGERTGGRIGARNTTIIEQRLIHVPFWRMRGRLMGWISGHTSKTVRFETAPDGPTTAPAYTTLREETETFSRLVFKRVDWSTPACVLPCLGLQGIALRTDFLDWDVLDDSRRGDRTVALPTRSERSARRDALAYLTRLAVPPRATVRASRFHLFGSRFSLYYYPVHLIRYGCAGRTYTITIDGRSGAVVHAEAPETKRRDPKGIFFVPAVLAFLAGTWFPLAGLAAAAVYVVDAIEARRPLSPLDWLSFRILGLLGGED